MLAASGVGCYVQLHGDQQDVASGARFCGIGSIMSCSVVCSKSSPAVDCEVALTSAAVGMVWSCGDACLCE